MALLVFNPDGSPKNELAVSECKKWRVSTHSELAARKARIRKVILEHSKPAKRSLDARNCGTGAGGFQPGNTCAKGHAEDPGSPIDARGESPKRVSELLLAGHNVTVRGKDIDKIFRKMAGRDENPDITNLVIHGTTLFGGEGLGIARGDMPQLGDNIEGFRQKLREAGIESEDVRISPLTAKPTQKEITGRKAGIKYLKIVKNGRDAIKPVIVSRDNFVIDGHHGWAASVAKAMSKPDYKMNAIVLDADHQTALRHAHNWMHEQGVQPKTLDSRELRNCGTGAGGFQPGNTCANGGDGDLDPSTKYNGQLMPVLTDAQKTKLLAYYHARLDAQPEWYRSLTVNEEEAIWHWTGAGYEDVRKQQKSGQKTSTTLAWESAIEKAPDVEGTFYRGLSGWYLTQTDIDKYKPGAIITLQADSSASKSKEYATEHSTKLTQIDPEDVGEEWTKKSVPGLVLTFRDSSAKDLSGLRSVSYKDNSVSEPSNEQEVILRQGGRYIVTSVNGREVELRRTQ